MPYDLSPLHAYFKHTRPDELARYLRLAAGSPVGSGGVRVKKMGAGCYALHWLAQELDFIQEVEKGGTP